MMNSSNNNNNDKDEKQQDAVSANDNIVEETVSNVDTAVAAILPAAKCNNSTNNDNNGGKDNLAKQRAVWLAIKVEPDTCQYFEPMLTQMKLVLEHGYTPAEAYNTGGDQNWACSICRIATDEPCFYQDAINICSAAGRECHKIEPYLHNNVEMH